MSESWVPPCWQERAIACACMALLAAWLALRILGPTSIAPAVVALLAGGVVLVLPRLGFVGVAAALATAAALRGHSGEAGMVLVGALVPMSVLLLRSGVVWPIAAGAPALGAIGLAGAWPALAAFARSAWQRAALGFAGWVWLLLATPLSGLALYLPPPAGLPPHSLWSSSAYYAINHVLAPLASSGALAGAPVWALAAAALPYLVRRRSLALDTVRVAGWAAFVASATELAVRTAGHGPSLPTPNTEVTGAVVAAVVALCPSLAAAWRRGSRSNEPRARIP